MDFLKSCRTNVRMVEDIFQTQYMLYSSGEESTSHTRVLQQVADLREKRVLCTAVQQELWVFGPLEQEINQLLEPDKNAFGLRNEGSIDDASVKAADGRPIQDIFLKAVEGFIAYTLANAQELIHIAPWTWLYSSYVERARPYGHVIAKITPTITDTGTLYLSTTVRPSTFHPISWSKGVMSEVQTVILAPSGVKAKVHMAAVEAGVEQRQSMSETISHSRWKQRLIHVLTVQGLHVDLEEDWITVELFGSQKQSRVLWPVRLCFTLDRSSASRDDLGDMQDWRCWFGGTDYISEGYQNPFEVAEDWFISSAAREKTDATEMDGGGAAIENTQGSTSMIPETPLATSSPFNQRAIDHQAAMLGIYPTPPDGLIPAQALPQQSMGDGPNVPLQSDTGGLSNDLQGLPGSDDTQGLRQSVVSSTGPHTYQAETDDLFEDMGGIDFGANEVADADFDYFDEPDDIDAPPENIDGDVDMANDTKPQELFQAGAVIQNDSLQDVDTFRNEMHIDANEDDVRPASSGEDANVLAKLENEVQQQSLLPVEQDEMPDVVASEDPEKPLSPFGIRERLLPPPIPASAHQARPLNRRTSTFGPVSFNENLNLSVKYADHNLTPAKDTKHNGGTPNISLPVKRRRPRHSKEGNDPDSGVGDMLESESSEADSYESSSDTDMSEDAGLPPRLPWDSKKRKRSSTQDEYKLLDGLFTRSWDDRNAEFGESEDGEAHTEKMLTTLSGGIERSQDSRTIDLSTLPSQDKHADRDDDIESIEEFFELSKLDLVYVAQVISEQAVSTTTSSFVSSGVKSVPRNADDTSALKVAVKELAESAIDQLFPENDSCTVANLALIKEPPSRQPTNPGKTSQTPHPRLQREQNMQSGPDYFSIPPPFVRIHRGSDTWEMLPTALPFWSAMGLGPASSSKDLQIVSVSPDNEALVGLTRDFVTELGGIYEMWKLGSFITMKEFKELERLDAYENGIVPVQLDDDAFSFQSAMKAYAETSTELGKALAKAGHSDPDRTIVVLMLNPFQAHERAQQFLSACFWLLYKAYRDHAPKAHKTAPRSDIILQILPISLIASPDGVVALDAHQFGRLATEIYDRAPPSVKDAGIIDVASALPMFAAPAVELASLPPKKIIFQLSADAPSDLLHEGSVLHIAYALSPDEEWMTICWVDSTGRYQRTSSTCFRGRSFKDIAGEIWDHTLEVLTARDVTWRVFIVATEHISPSIVSCWKALVATKPRRQMLHVTLLSVNTESPLQVTLPMSSDDAQALGQASGPGVGFLTPVTTPQGATFTVSPDASGQSNTPLTPAPTEPASAVAENDPDAHLVDITDESWGMLLATPFNAQSSFRRDSNKYTELLASGVLFKRGQSDLPTDSHQLDALGVNVHWDIRIRPGGHVDEGPGKQAENTLREVLRMYRSLNLLASVKNVGEDASDDGRPSKTNPVLPMHVMIAVKGAEALDRFLS